MSNDLNITDQMITDTEGALYLWLAGTDPREVMEDTGIEYNLNEVQRGGELLEQYEFDTVALLTLWRGYLGASEDEGTEPTVTDFILATFTMLTDN